LITIEDYDKSLDGFSPYIANLLKDKDILVLGYSLLDWNMRIILRLLKIADSYQRLWVISGHEDEHQEIWKLRALNIYSLNLGVFAEELQKTL